MYPAYAKWVQSHRDLPIKLNQWCNVVVSDHLYLYLTYGYIIDTNTLITLSSSVP